MKQHLRNLVCTVAAFYVGCILPVGIMGIVSVLLPNPSRSVSHILLGIAIVAGVAAIPLSFNALNRLWRRVDGRNPSRHTNISSHAPARQSRTP